jgi:hypothetical protein
MRDGHRSTSVTLRGTPAHGRKDRHCAAPSATALRSRRYRDRKKDGTRCIQFRVSSATTDLFVRLGLLESHARHDRCSIEGVFYGLANVGLAARHVLSQLGARGHQIDQPFSTTD